LDLNRLKAELLGCILSFLSVRDLLLTASRINKRLRKARASYEAVTVRPTRLAQVLVRCVPPMLTKLNICSPRYRHPRHVCLVEPLPCLRALQLRSVGLSVEFAQWIGSLAVLRELQLFDVDVSDLKLGLIAAAPRLESLTCDRAAWFADGVELANMKQLRHLALHGVDVVRETALNTLAALPLVSLELKGKFLSTSCVSALRQFASSLQTLKVQVEDGAAVFSDLAWCVRLTTLELEGRPSARGFSTFVERAHALRTLDMSARHFSPAAFSRVSQLKLLCTLHVSDIDWPGDESWNLRGALRVRHLALRRCRTTTALMRGAPLDLESLKLDICRVTDESLASLAVEQLATPGGAKLRELEVCDAPDITDTTMLALAKLPLESLHFAHCEQITGACADLLPRSLRRLVFVWCKKLAGCHLHKLQGMRLDYFAAQHCENLGLDGVRAVLRHGPEVVRNFSFSNSVDGVNLHAFARGQRGRKLLRKVEQAAARFRAQGEIECLLQKRLERSL
jgi:hypothetical protein